MQCTCTCSCVLLLYIFLTHLFLLSLQGQASDIEIHAKEILALRERLVQIYAHHCRKPAEEVANAKERDNFMTPNQARSFGLIDEVVDKRNVAG